MSQSVSILLGRLKRFQFAANVLVCVGLMNLLIHSTAFAGGTDEVPSVEETGTNLDSAQVLNFDETSVFVNVQRVGGIEMPAAISDDKIYLSITDLFDFLKIKNSPSLGFYSVSGFFIDQDATFLIDYQHNRIIYKGKLRPLAQGDLIRTDNSLFLRMERFSEIFGLECSFDFSNLQVRVSTKYDLPAVKEMQFVQMRQNVDRLKGEVKADTVIGRSKPSFGLGVADWSVTATQFSGGKKDLRATLGLGAVIAGGEANILLNYSSNVPFSERQQFYQWRHANNDNKALRQVTLGRVLPQGTAAIYDPVIGVQITNTPTTYRKSFGSYRLSKTTHPGWTVELYVNNVLVDYTKADASGFFTFDVPLVYGNSNVKLRYYGPYGETRIAEENIIIPFNFLPKKELEYSVTAGMVEDTLKSRYGRAAVNYGLTSKITIGGGTEYLSSVASGPNMPFVNASMRVTSDLLVSGEYTYGIRAKAMLAYRLPLDAQLELNYTRYDRDQKALIYNYLEESKMVLTVPLHTKSFGMVTRFLYNRALVTDKTTYSTAEWTLSAAFRNVNANINTYMVSAGSYDPPKFDPHVYTNASVAFRLPRGYTLTPQAQYSYMDKRVMSFKVDAEKYICNRGVVNLTYEQNLNSNIFSVGAGFRYDLSFAKASATARQYNDVTAISESLSGSVLLDGKTGYHHFSDRPGVGRACITLMPFLDLNGNGRRDSNEPKVQGLKVRVSSGRIEYSNQDTMIRLFDLEPYTNYLVDVSQNNFENISWQIRNKTMSVAVEPNQMRLIEVPVTVMGEAAGNVYLQDSMGQKGQGRVRVCFYANDSTQVGCTTTDPEGYFSYMGLKNGSYTVRLDPEQLNKLHMSAFPASSHVEVNNTREGVIIGDLDFRMKAIDQTK